MNERSFKSTPVADLISRRLLRIEDGNHGEYRPRREEFIEHGVAFIRAADMGSSGIDFRGAEKINATAYTRIRKGIGAPLDILLSHKGTVGKVALAPPGSPQYVCSPQTTFWRSLNHNEINPRYLYFALQSREFKEQLSALQSETDMAPYVSLTAQKKLWIMLPSIEQQQAISAALGALDDKIAVNDRIASGANALLKAYFMAAMRSANRKMTLHEIIDLRYGKALTEADRVPGTVPVYGSNGISGWHQTALVSGPGIIIGRKGANAGSVSWSQCPFWVIDTAFYAESKDNAIPPEFIFLLLDSVGLRDVVGDSAIPGLNREIALSCEALLPPSEMIDNFVTRAKALLSLSAQVANESRMLAQLRDTLLPKLMSGEILIRDAEKTVEEAL